MKEEMETSPLALRTQDQLAADEIVATVTELDAQVSDRVAWVIEQIAGNAYMPAAPGQPWAGRIDVTAKVMGQFAIGEVEAEQLVRQAQEELWKGGENGQQVQRRLMVARLTTIRTIVIEGMKEPRRVMVWQFVPKKRGKMIQRDANGQPIMLRVPKREMVHHGLDYQAVRLLIDLERTIAELTSLNDGGDGTDVLERIFARIESDADGNEKASASVQIEQVRKASPAAQAVIAKALEENSRRTKRVDSMARSAS